ncbi:MAG: type I restriction-modification system subunit M [Microcoleus vaginatus WJT46-NPBG5]|nr:type I restriction-modification system subunit M [Microcoleus vaginatus WJT46-NPBG5]
MLSPQLKREIRQLWDYFWSGGIANPLAAIEQITYLVFVKRLEDLKPKDLVIPEACRWSNFKHLSGDALLKRVRGEVFDWLRSLDTDNQKGQNSESETSEDDTDHKKDEKRQGRMSDAVFLIPNAALLRRAIDTIDKLFIPSRNQDIQGDIYEHLLSEIAEAGKNGQFRTPRHIIRTMCDLVNPQWNDRICDPACGTAGFLVNAYQHVLKTHTYPVNLVFEGDGTPINTLEGRPFNMVGENLSPEQDKYLRENALYGYDFDKTMVRLGWMNLIQHGIEKPKVNYANTLGSAFNQKIQSGEVGDFSVILANPPFTGSLDKTDIGETLQDLKTNKTELLFIELILQLLAIGGRAAVIVPEGVLFGSTKAHKTLREKLVAENTLRGVISLPGGVFQPYTGVKTSILLFNKGGKTDEVWFYEVAKDGETLDAKRTPKPQENDLWDLTLKYRLQFEESAPAFVDGETWKQWQTMEPKRRSISYAKPIIETELIRSEEPEEREINDKIKKIKALLHLWYKSLLYIQKQQLINYKKLEFWKFSIGYHFWFVVITFEVKILERLETEELTEPKNWLSSTEDLSADNYNLSAGRYKPLTLITEKYDPPAQIISELQDLENKIQSKLNSLLLMIEGKK